MANGFGAPNFGGGNRFARDMGQLRLGANVLAVPARIEAAHHQAAIDRALLGRMGMSELEQRTLVPEPPLSLPGGIAGKALSGLGTVGSILSTALGQPVAAPRVQTGQLLQAEALRQGLHRRKMLEKAAARVERSGDLQDEEVIKGLTADFLRAGASSEALALIKQQNKGREATLSGALSRQALRYAGSPAGTPMGDQAIMEMHAGWKATEAYMKEMGKYREPLPELRAGVEAFAAGARAEATQSATQYARTRENLKKIRNLLPRVRQAVERRIHATGYTDSLMQGGRLHFTKKSQWAGQHLFRQEVDQEMVDDIQAIMNMTAFAGAFIKGAELDSGKLAEGDIMRALPSLPSIFDTRMGALAALNEWEKMVGEVEGLPLDEQLDQAIGRIIQKMGDFAEETGRLGSRASGITPDMADDFETPEEGVTGGRQQERLEQMLKRMEEKYGGE